MKKDSKKILLKLRTGSVRVVQKEHGMFDGRFRTRVEENRNAYSRKKKHKKDTKNEDI